MDALLPILSLMIEENDTLDQFDATFTNRTNYTSYNEVHRNITMTSRINTIYDLLKFNSTRRGSSINGVTEIKSKKNW